MKETIGSLRAYFVVVAVVAGLRGTLLLLEPLPEGIVTVIDAFLRLGFAIAYLYIGIFLRKLLVQSSKVIAGVILTSMALLIANFSLSLLSDVQTATSAAIQLVIGLFVTGYLLRNVTRLSSEQSAQRNA